jgi:hypothetical protein
MIIRRPPGSLSSQAGQMSMQRPTCTLKTSIWSNGYTSTHGNPSEPSIYSYAHTLTYRFLRNVNVVKCVCHDIQEPVKCQFAQMNLRRPTGTLQIVNLNKWVYDDLQVPLKSHSAQMSIPRPTRTFKYSIWSNEYTTTYSYLWILNLVKWVYHDLLVPSFKYSIWSNEYITTYPYLQILNLVKSEHDELQKAIKSPSGQWVCDDPQQPMESQSGKMSRRMWLCR